MTRRHRHLVAGAGAIAGLVTPAAAVETPREVLTQVAYMGSNKPLALSRVQAVIARTSAILAHEPQDHEAKLTLAMATGYRAKLSHSRADALAARTQFEALVASNPNDPEALAGLGAWHMASVTGLGGFMARAVLGARRTTGLDYLDRAVQRGGNRATFLALAGMFRLEADPGDATGARLIRAATTAATPTPTDRVLQRKAADVAATLASGQTDAIREAARRSAPFGWAD